MYNHKPTYKTLKESLICMKKLMIEHKVKNLSIPRIGCGLDKLNWNEVRDIIFDVFRDVNDLKITVCVQ